MQRVDWCEPHPIYNCVLSNDSTELIRLRTSDSEQAYKVFRAYVGPHYMLEQGEEWLGMSLPYEVKTPYFTTIDRRVEVIGSDNIMLVGVDTFREGMADILYHVIQSYATCKVLTRDGQEWRRMSIPTQLWIIPIV